MTEPLPWDPASRPPPTPYQLEAAAIFLEHASACRQCGDKARRSALCPLGATLVGPMHPTHQEGVWRLLGLRK